ncbi:MAG TPA: hypothetical protein VMB47_07680 [Candidatus Aquilonibacter sp.]|nr:hypothetical protein [Candidatus Aquilonibacter sp.]
MYIYQQQQMSVFTAPSGAPWPRGTAIALEPFPQHAGFIDYTTTGEQIMVHKSLRGAVVTWPEEFNPQGYAYRVLRVPANQCEADRWLSTAYAAVERGDSWSGFDNCQDFIWQAIIERKHSPTRDALLGVAIVGGVIAMAING